MWSGSIFDLGCCCIGPPGDHGGDRETSIMHLGSGAHWVCGSLPWGPMFCVRCSVLLGVRCSVPLEVWCSVPLEVQCYVPGVLSWCSVPLGVGCSVP